MRKTQLSALIVAALTLAACESTNIPVASPLGSAAIADIDGTYRGDWTLNWSTTNPNNPFFPGESFVCEGNVEVIDHQNGYSFGGAWLVMTEGACSQGSPVSGDVVDGRIRDVGEAATVGVSYTMEVQPTTGEAKAEDNIWEDIFAGTGVIVPQLLIGCNMITQDNQMNGAIDGTRLQASASAALSCAKVILTVGDQIFTFDEDARLQIRFDGVRQGS